MANETNKWLISMLERIDQKTDLHGEQLSSINEHLKTLNGKVIRNMNQIECNRSDIIQHKIQWAKISGMAAGISAAIFTAGTFIIKIFGRY